MSDSPPAVAPVLALVRDMIFSTRITGTARAMNVPVQVVSQPGKLLIGEIPLAGDLLIVDLNLDGAIEPAAQWGKSAGKPVVGFVSHVDQEIIAQARQAGISRVMARSEFVKVLPQLLRDRCATSSG